MKKLTNLSVGLVQRFLPDSYIFCLILAIVVFIIAIPVTGLSVIQICTAFGGGMWNLLSFSMQMALVVVLGTAFATAPPIKKIIVWLAGIPKKPVGAVAFTTLISCICMFINWGFGLVAGALLAKEVAKKVKGVDYPLLIASAYSSIAIWHAGLSGSIPLSITALGDDGTVANTGGYLTETVAISETITSSWNLIMVAAAVVVLIVMNSIMVPKGDDVKLIDPKLLVEEEAPEKVKTGYLNEKLENSVILNYIIVVIIAVYIVYYFVTSGDILNSLTLNIVNLIFLCIGMACHFTPINYVKAIGDAAGGAAGVILQFPFYAGIQGIMVASQSSMGVGDSTVSVASALSNAIVAHSTARTFPVLCYLAAGVVNFFVPSGGGQWSVQGPIMMPAGGELGVSPAVTAMGIAWGDAWTNLLQPFWALPALGIAGLGIKDIMGYCIIDLIAVGVVTAILFLVIVPILG